MLGPDEGTMIPVRKYNSLAGMSCADTEQTAAAETLVLPVEGKGVETATGIWDAKANNVMVFIANLEPQEVPIETMSEFWLSVSRKCNAA